MDALVFSLVFILGFIWTGVSAGQEFVTLNGDDWTATSSNKSLQVPATVPGGIYTDLLRAGVIEEPYFEDNDIKLKWVGKDSWSYTRSFQADETLTSRQRLTLVCHGLDTAATIYLNGNLVGTTSNMFVRYVFDVKNFIQPGNNVMNVSFQSAVTYAESKYNQESYVIPPTCPPPAQRGECHVNFIRKIQSSFSWDWGPSFPTQGIWKNIELHGYDGVVLRDVTITTARQDVQKWRIKIKAFFELSNKQLTAGHIRVIIGKRLAYSNQTNLIATSDLEAYTKLTLDLPEDWAINEWWPAGYGNQNLYNITVEYVDTASGDSTLKVVRTGFRTIELLQHPIRNATGATFYFRVNGVPIFIKGSNWIPADSFPERITPEYIRHLLTSSRDCNMNALRIWGGGMFESDLFYNVADELGILLWHDLMFACALYPVNQPFLDSVSTEVRQQVRRLQYHPSVLLWSGNNENEGAISQGWWPQIYKDSNLYKNDYRKLYITTIMPIVSEEDPSRAYLPSSPSNGIDTEAENWIADNPADEHWGDVHFYNYFGNTWDWQMYPIPRFASEYGVQSYPSFETLKSVSRPTDWTYPQNDFLEHRQHSPTADSAISSSITTHLFSPNRTGGDKSFKDNIYMSQITQAMTIKTETEHYRRYRSQLNDGRGLTMGALFWQLNDIWQAPSWASIEYGGRWKMLQYFARRFFSPQLISPLVNGNLFQVYLVSDSDLDLSGINFTVQVYKWSSFTPLGLVTGTQNLLGQGSYKVLEMNLDGPDGILKKSGCVTAFECFFYLRLKDSDNKELSHNFLFPQELNTVSGLGKANIQITTVKLSSENVFEITLTSDAIAPFVWLSSGPIAGEFSDNGFLMVEPSIVLLFNSRTQTSAEQLETNLSVQSLMDVTS